MSYRIEITPPARKEIRGLSGYLRAQAMRLIRALQEEPRPPRAKELQNHPNIYRIWLAGRWRIVYEIDGEDLRILILRVRSKRLIDYESVSSWVHQRGAEYDATESKAKRRAS